MVLTYGEWSYGWLLQLGERSEASGPISPSFFIIVAEALSRRLSALRSVGSFNRYFTTSRCPFITHMDFADDILLFSSGEVASIEAILWAVKDYEEGSGQRVNARKSLLYVHQKCMTARRELLSTTSGIGVGSPPFTYLGCPLSYGRSRVDLFVPLIAKVHSKIDGWHNRILLPGGKLVLVKHVLGSMVMYTLAASNPPGIVVKHIEQSFSSFLGGQKGGMNKQV
ncbi:uncharacterized protein M6B38_198205 [Iris pallida]|uniref:Reverse transcriptase domain-containing protein n=1 Tax=Iris pallida TaxID=29817 RepID=A0AAX6EC23_IRIPA|nr:uncharacterized protein M6B38_198205 [Iris pallida]